MPNILPVTDRETYDKVVAAALADNHYALAPTHYWKKGDEITGYFSNGMLQATHFWMRSDSKPRDSFNTILACKEIAFKENPVIARQGRAIICCSDESPFRPFMEKHFNFKPIVKTVLFLGEA